MSMKFVGRAGGRASGIPRKHVYTYEAKKKFLDLSKDETESIKHLKSEHKADQMYQARKAKKQRNKLNKKANSTGANTGASTGAINPLRFKGPIDAKDTSWIDVDVNDLHQLTDKQFTFLMMWHNDFYKQYLEGPALTFRDLNKQVRIKLESELRGAPWEPNLLVFCREYKQSTLQGKMTDVLEFTLPIVEQDMGVKFSAAERELVSKTWIKTFMKIEVTRLVKDHTAYADVMRMFDDGYTRVLASVSENVRIATGSYLVFGLMSGVGWSVK